MEVTKYELGGVAFVVIDGDVYCRYADVFEEAAEEEADVEEEPLAPAQPKAAPRPPRDGKVRRCGLCGEPGHQKRTCTAPPGGILDSDNPDPNEEEQTGYMSARARKLSSPEPEPTIDDLLRQAFESGCSFDEVVMMYPQSPLSEIKRIEQEWRSGPK